MDLKGDKLALQRLKEAATKIELSASQATEINLPYITECFWSEHLNVKLTRAEIRATC